MTPSTILSGSMNKWREGGYGAAELEMPKINK